MSKDVFHLDQSQPLSELQQGLVKGIKEKAQELFNLFEEALYTREGDLGGLDEAQHKEVMSAAGRCVAVAKTELETSVMWAVKGVTK